MVAVKRAVSVILWVFAFTLPMITGFFIVYWLRIINSSGPERRALPLILALTAIVLVAVWESRSYGERKTPRGGN